ncbi:MAG: hypothetical protein JO032_04495 [Alphaproteobacteria bacterium]|nr:hypothetical protein [Alphaproteobacteria bacterium]
MDFTIQYFARYDRLVFEERVEAEELVDVLDRTRFVVRESGPSEDQFEEELHLMGYVVLDGRGRQVGRGYRRDV